MIVGPVRRWPGIGESLEDVAGRLHMVLQWPAALAVYVSALVRVIM